MQCRYVPSEVSPSNRHLVPQLCPHCWSGNSQYWNNASPRVISISQLQWRRRIDTLVLCYCWTICCSWIKRKLHRSFHDRQFLSLSLFFWYASWTPWQMIIKKKAFFNGNSPIWLKRCLRLKIFNLEWRYSQWIFPSFRSKDLLKNLLHMCKVKVEKVGQWQSQNISKSLTNLWRIKRVGTSIKCLSQKKNK